MTMTRRVADGGISAAPPSRLDVEATATGPQALERGVMPIMPLDRLIARAAAALESGKPQRPCDLVAGRRNHSARVTLAGALFDLNARNQRDLFQPKDV